MYSPYGLEYILILPEKLRWFLNEQVCLSNIDVKKKALWAFRMNERYIQLHIIILMIVYLACYDPFKWRENSLKSLYLNIRLQVPFLFLIKCYAFFCLSSYHDYPNPFLSPLCLSQTQLFIVTYKIWFLYFQLFISLLVK